MLVFNKFNFSSCNKVACLASVVLKYSKHMCLSFIVSGPRRYDYFDGQWVYLRDGRGLHRLLEDELTEIMGFNIELKKCKYYSWGMPNSK